MGGFLSKGSHGQEEEPDGANREQVFPAVAGDGIAGGARAGRYPEAGGESGTGVSRDCPPHERHGHGEDGES